MTKGDTHMTAKSTYREDRADAYLSSARDMGDPAAVASAMRVWWASRFPRSRPCTDADRAMFIEWLAA
jgi:hypothetical protein